jgi:ribosomal protein S18 acetylase RimI-like enzyme
MGKMDSANLTFREATPADALALADFAKQMFTETFGHAYRSEDLQAHLAEKYTPAEFKKYLEQGDEIILVHDAQELVGYCKMGDVGVPMPHVPKDAQEIHRLYIHRKYHGGGLGQELFRRAMESKRLKAAPIVYLGVWEENDRAKRFYFKNDFMPVGRYLYPVGQHFDNEMILARVAG